MAVGYRFSPRDEEILHCLQLKINGDQTMTSIIPEKDLYAVEPWLLGHGKSRELRPNEWYYCFKLDKLSDKRINRCVVGKEGGGCWQGYTGDFEIFAKSEGGGGKVLTGCKKTLTFFKKKKMMKDEAAAGDDDESSSKKKKSSTRKKSQKAEEGEKSDWVMHEYRLANYTNSEEWLLCRIRYTGKNPLTPVEPLDETDNAVGAEYEDVTYENLFGETSGDAAVAGAHSDYQQQIEITLIAAEAADDQPVPIAVEAPQEQEEYVEGGGHQISEFHLALLDAAARDPLLHSVSVLTTS